jgi:hypothetical protein
MIKKLILLVAATLFSTLAMQTASASGSMRCGTHIISSGQRKGTSKYEVLSKCGEPAERFGNTWIYKRGSATYEVHFNSSGDLIRIS